MIQLNWGNVNAYACYELLLAMSYSPQSAICQGVCESSLLVYLWSLSTLIVRNYIFWAFFDHQFPLLMVVSIWGYQGLLDHHSKLDIYAL